MKPTVRKKHVYKLCLQQYDTMSYQRPMQAGRRKTSFNVQSFTTKISVTALINWIQKCPTLTQMSFESTHALGFIDGMACFPHAS